MERLIDEKRLIEDLIKCKELGRKSFEAVLKIIEEQAKVKVNCSRREWYQKGYQDGLNANRWIPCSENLPENTRTVIVDVEELRNPTFAFYMKLSKKWVLVERDFIYLEDFHVLAWQPLPEPYKEE